MSQIGVQLQPRTSLQHVSADKHRNCVKRMTKAAAEYLENNPIGSRVGDGVINTQKLAAL